MYVHAEAPVHNNVRKYRGNIPMKMQVHTGACLRMSMCAHITYTVKFRAVVAVRPFCSIPYTR